MRHLFWTELWLAESVVRNAYEIHRVLWRFFPNNNHRDFLFSVIERKYGHGAKVLLQSISKPIIDDSISGENAVLRESKDLSGLLLRGGQQLRFRLVANPTKKIKDQNDPERAIRVPHIGDENQIAWLNRKLDGIAHICHAESANLEPIYFSKPGHRGKIQPVLFTGVLEVDSGDAFIAMMKEGIGSAKSFGCGLLQISRL